MADAEIQGAAVFEIVLTDGVDGKAILVGGFCSQMTQISTEFW